MQCEESQLNSEICAICHDDVIDAGTASCACSATGSLKTSCGHIFHPKCLWKWYSSQEDSNCPMCRAPATEWEQTHDREEESEESEEEDYNSGGVIRISRAGLEFILRQAGGLGMTAALEAEFNINEFNEIVIERFMIESILRQQGGTPLSDAQWTQLTSVYPPAEHNGDDDHGDDDVDSVEEPEEEPEEEPRVTLTRAQIGNLLRAMGSSSTVTDFFNEEDGEEETLLVTMTHASLEARLSSILGRPVQYMGPARVILNPEDEDEI